jgi:hypothetical protein
MATDHHQNGARTQEVQRRKLTGWRRDEIAQRVADQEAVEGHAIGAVLVIVNLLAYCGPRGFQGRADASGACELDRKGRWQACGETPVAVICHPLGFQCSQKSRFLVTASQGRPIYLGNAGRTTPTIGLTCIRAPSAGNAGQLTVIRFPVAVHGP